MAGGAGFVAHKEIRRGEREENLPGEKKAGELAFGRKKRRNFAIIFWSVGRRKLRSPEDGYNDLSSIPAE